MKPKPEIGWTLWIGGWIALSILIAAAVAWWPPAEPGRVVGGGMILVGCIATGSKLIGIAAWNRRDEGRDAE